MLTPNMNYANLKDSYLFYNIAKKTEAYLAQNVLVQKIYRLGIGDVSLPLCSAVTDALHSAVEDMTRKDTFQGYVDECGMPFLRDAIAKHYEKRGVSLTPDEVFISSGASDELGDILDLFDKSSSAFVIEPAYPAYVDANIIEGRDIIHFNSSEKDGFAPYPDDSIKADLIYICSPNNPTGAVFTKEKLASWVDYANKNGSVILFDAAYEAFIEDDNVPHSIFEINGAKTCAIEICSLSKTAGFTGTRLGYTVIPKELERNGMNLNAMWVRNRTTKTNGVSYIIQKGASAVFTEEGQKQIKENIEVYKQNARVIMQALDRCNISYCGGKNAPYIWLKCPDGKTSWEFFDYLLENIQVVGTPGVGFGENGDGWFRFTTFGDTEDTKIAAQRLVELLGEQIMIYPEGYKSKLTQRETQYAIKTVKDTFQLKLSKALNLDRITAPIMVTKASGINDDLNGVERKVHFTMKNIDGEAEVVQSLAKWKRQALYRYGYEHDEGIYTDMNAIRRDDDTDNLHSLFVDQWDWCRVITKEERSVEFLKEIVRKIVSAIVETNDVVKSKYPMLDFEMSEDVYFITTQELEDIYPDLSGKEREDAIVKEHGTVFLMQIGGKLKSGKKHDGRAPDYDDWELNGDIFAYNKLLDCAFEISSMGIRVDAESLHRQLEAEGCLEREQFPFHKAILDGTMPLTIGGGIGQSRLCMLLLQKAHIGEVQCAVWSDEMREDCKKHNIILL